MSLRSISVVIPNYNGRKLLEENIPYVLAALRKSKAEYEVIISDDASSDDSISFIRSNYPEIILIENKTNAGFAPNINRGIFAATKDLVLCLNSDVQLTEDYFANQFSYFDNPTTFGVMGKIIGLDSDQIQDAAKYPELKLIKLKATVNYLPANPLESFHTPTLFLSGANALIDRKKLFVLDGFDEVYKPFYNEDVDLSLRAWRMGWECYYENKSVCRHPSSVTIKSHHKAQKIKSISLSNKLILHYIHLNGIRRITWRFSILFELLFSWITWKTHFYKGFILYLKKRKEAKQSTVKFKQTQQLYSVNRQLTDVIKTIKNKISGIAITKF